MCRGRAGERAGKGKGEGTGKAGEAVRRGYVIGCEYFLSSFINSIHKIYQGGR
jgi:hypothetical protein